MAHTQCRLYTKSAPLKPIQGQEEVNFDFNEVPTYHICVKRVYVDIEGFLLYQNQGRDMHKTIIFDGYEYPLETTLHMYERKGTTMINFYDDW